MSQTPGVLGTTNRSDARRMADDVRRVEKELLLADLGQSEETVESIRDRLPEPFT